MFRLFDSESKWYSITDVFYIQQAFPSTSIDKCYDHIEYENFDIFVTFGNIVLPKSLPQVLFVKALLRGRTCTDIDQQIRGVTLNKLYHITFFHNIVLWYVYFHLPKLLRTTPLQTPFFEGSKIWKNGILSIIVYHICILYYKNPNTLYFYNMM